MNVLIMGATGQLGRHVTMAALEAGHRVTAFARNPNSLEINHPNLNHVAADAYRSDSVDDAMPGHNAVIVTLGTGMSRKNTLRSEGTRNVIAAMKKHGVKRLICQTTLGCQETRETLNFFWKRVMFGALIKPVFLDHELQERITQASELDWTIVRPSAFKEQPGKQKLLIDFPPNQSGLKFTVAKSEVAGFLVEQLDDQQYLRKAVSISR